MTALPQSCSGWGWFQRASGSCQDGAGGFGRAFVVLVGCMLRETCCAPLHAHAGMDPL